MHREVLSCPRCLFICLCVCLLVCFAFAGWLVGWLVGGLLVMCMCVISGNTRCGPNSCYANASLVRHTITCTPSPYICLVQAHNGHVLLPKVYICLLPDPGPPQPMETRKRAAEAIQVNPRAVGLVVRARFQNSEHGFIGLPEGRLASSCHVL